MAEDWDMLDWRSMTGRDMVGHQQKGRCSCFLERLQEKT